MELSHSAVKKDYIDVDDTYAVMPLFKMSGKSNQSLQKINTQEDAGKANEKYREKVDSYSRSIIDNAKSESRSLIEKAKLESEKLKKQGYKAGHDKGYSDGFKEGKDMAMKQAQDMIKDARGAALEAHRVSREYIDGRKEEIVNLALNIAEKIIGYKCSRSDEVITKIITDSINSCVAKKQLIIRVNPMDYASVDCRRDEISKIAGEKVILNLIRDSSIKMGGCRLESESSFVDADIDSQLERIREALLSQNV